jgi:hypothetical protein
MPNSGLRGPFPLSNTSIDNNVTYRAPGAYALGNSQADGFHISYVGRSDTDVNDRLKKHVGHYVQFKYEYCSSPKAAFEKECNLYHDFTPPDNIIHPDRPAGSDWKCPRCYTFG